MMKKRPLGMTKRQLVEWLLDQATPTAGPSAHVDDECWECSMAAKKNGYSYAHFDGKQRLVHRLVWEVEHGCGAPDRTVIRHRCDNRHCIRPSHLEDGTVRDNSRDMVERGVPPGSKLTRTLVARIRSLYATGRWSQYALADMFGVTRANIGYIVRRDTWDIETPTLLDT